MAVIPVGEGAEATALDAVQALRRGGVVAEIAYKGNLKRRMERANRIGATIAVIIGAQETASRTVQVKDMASGSQQTMQPDAISRFIRAGRPRLDSLGGEAGDIGMPGEVVRDGTRGMD